MAEILERNTATTNNFGSSSTRGTVENSDMDVMGSWQKEYENLMEGIGANSDKNDNFGDDWCK